MVKRNGSVYLYEMAIPKSELADLRLQAGTDFGFIFKIGGGEGASVEYGKDKAVTKKQRSQPASVLGIPFQLRRALDAGELSRSGSRRAGDFDGVSRPRYDLRPVLSGS